MLTNHSAAESSLQSETQDNQLYSQGFSAFIKNEYDTAHRLWLSAAKQKNPKAMFNLGLLHERGLIESASQQQAENWYKLAGEQGYVAAYYHLAKYLAADAQRIKEVDDLMKKAAAGGYAPAMKHVSGTQVQYLSETWLRSQPQNYWTIQMLAFQDEQKVRSFIDQHDLKNEAAYFIEENKKGVWYKLVYGVYSDKQQADEARSRLSRNLKEHGPWLRTLGSIQEIIASK